MRRRLGLGVYVPQRLHEIADLGPFPPEMTGLKTRTAKHLAGGPQRNSTQVGDFFKLV
jgi:hypothetical protein